VFKYKYHQDSKTMFESPGISFATRHQIHFTWKKPDNKPEKFTIKMKYLDLESTPTFILTNKKMLLNELYKTFEQPLPTGNYHITFKTATDEHEMTFVLPAMGRVSKGGSCFLIDGKDFGYDKWCIMTNHHVISNTKNKEIRVMFDEVHLRLRYWYFKTHTNQNQGLDYTIVGLTKEQMNMLKEANIYPNKLDFNSEFKHNGCMLIHKPNSVHCRVLHTPCKVVKRTPTRVRYEYLGESTAGGSSGSPVFAMNSNKEIAIQGLHKAKGVCIKMKSIKEDMMINKKK